MLVIRITVSMLMLTGGMWCKGENSTRECSNVGWSSVFVSLRVICGVFGKSFRIWKQENKQKKSLKAIEQTNVICWRGQKDSRILLAKRSSPSIPARKYWLESVFDSVAQIRKLLLFFFHCIGGLLTISLV